MILVDRGLLVLDQSVSTVLPEFRCLSRIRTDAYKDITFRHLLSHTSGLPHEAPVGNNFHGDCSFIDHVRSINEVWLKFMPGDGYSYSNLGYDLAAHAVEKITGKPFPDYMKDEVFSPLGMNRSTYDQREAISDLSTACGHSDTRPLPRVPIPMVGAGGMYSNAQDMARFVLFLLGKNEGILTKDVLESMYDRGPTGSTLRPNNHDWQYVLGFDVSLISGSFLLNHNGAGYGYLASQYVAMNEGDGVVILTNSIDHPQIQMILSKRILRCLATPQPTWDADGVSAAASHRDCVGVYRAIGPVQSWSKRTVNIRERVLFLDDERLTHYKDDLFFTESGDSVVLDGRMAIIGSLPYGKVEPAG